jgi:Tfp pilus assembly protein PilO
MLRNIIIFILLLAFIAAIVFLDVPKVQKILDLKREVETQQQRLSEKQLFLEKVDKLKKRYQDNEENLTKVNYILPSGKDVPNLIVQFEALALESGMILDSIQFLENDELNQSRAAQARAAGETTSKDYMILTAELKLSGSYFAFKNFLKLIENNIRLIDISSVAFNTETREETGGGGELIFDFNIRLNTYYQ